MPSVKELRQAFASERSSPLVNQRADELAIHWPGMKRLPPSRHRTARAVWFEDSDVLMAVVGDQERGDTDSVLVHGLHLAEGRSLRLVLPDQWAGPTRHRIPWLTARVEVHTYRPGRHPVLAQRLDKVQTRQNAGGPELSPWPHLGTSADWVRAVTEWASAHKDLDAAHTKSARGWSHQGQRVLKIQGHKTVKITAGIDAATLQAHSLQVTGKLTNAQVGEVIKHVNAGIDHARSNKFGAFEEHHLQGILRREPGLVRLEHPLLRELPAWRPIGGHAPLGRGYVDLVGLDPAGDIALVETKLGDDDMLVLQGLDYWIWATRAENREWLVRRLNADPARAQIRLLYAVGGKAAAKPAVNPRSRTLLKYLDPEVPWRIALMHDWNDSDKRHGEVLEPRHV